MEPIKKIASAQHSRKVKKMIIVKANFSYYLIAIVLVSLFFAHEYWSYSEKESDKLRTEWLELKAKRTIALDNIKKATIGTFLYDEYLKEKQLTNSAHEKLMLAVEQEKFNGFVDFQQFLNEFGWALGLFLYALFNLIFAFYNNRNSIYGQIILHTTLIFISLYFMIWALQSGIQDFSRPTYIFTSMGLSLFILLSVYYILKWRDLYFNQQKQSKQFIENAKLFIDDVNKALLNR